MHVLGFYECPNCGFQYIRNTDEVAIWINADDYLQLVQIHCNQCNTLIEDNIPFFEVAAFRNHGVKLKEFNDHFHKLTEQDIESWDIEKELKSVFGKI